MPTSFRELASYMDSVRPPTHLRGAPVSDDLGWLSLPAGDGHEGYDYNSDNEEAIRRLVADAGLAHGDDKGLRQLHRFQPAERRSGADRSLRTLAERHEDGTGHKFIFYNTWLLNAPTGKWDKPLLEERRAEIGRALHRDGYDVMGLCEVFDDSERDGITDEFSQTPETRMGPDQNLQESSGLFTLVTRPRMIVFDANHEFDDQGTFFEEDFHATKGVLYTEIDLDPDGDDRMHLDLYTTHTHAADTAARGNQIAELAAFVARTAQPENVVVVAGDMNVDFRDDQYSDMLETYAQIEVPVVTRGGRSQNLHRYVNAHRLEIAERMLEDAGEDGEDALEALRNGDFEGAVDELNDALSDLFGAGKSVLPFDPFSETPEQIASHFGWPVATHIVELDDLWLVRGGRAGATHKINDFDAVCTFDDDTSGGYSLCADYDTTEIASRESDTVPGYRLDYLFLQKPTDSHSFTLDCTRIRRRPFWRSDDSEIGYLDPTKFQHESSPWSDVATELDDDPDWLSWLLDPFDAVTGQIEDLLGTPVPHFMSDHLALEVEFRSNAEDINYRTRRFA